MSYEPRVYGLALAIAERAEVAIVDGRETTDPSEGVLRVSDACITLELPMVDGRTPVLAWDPAEVDWQALVSLTGVAP